MIVELSRRRLFVSISCLFLIATFIAAALPERPCQDNH
jgi:hypothetical protein